MSAVALPTVRDGAFRYADLTALAPLWPVEREDIHVAPGASDMLTLVVEGESGGKPFLVMLAANRHLDMKRLAAVAGEKKVRMAAHKDAEALTGLKVGGISALALTHKNWIVFIDQPATEHQHILMSAGQRGLDLRVPTMAMIGLLRARIADVGLDAE